MRVDLKDLPPEVRKKIKRESGNRKQETGNRTRETRILRSVQNDGGFADRLSALQAGGENKLHAERTEDGYASRKEAARAAELKLMERAGLISGLEEQKRFVLTPAIYRTEEGNLIKSYDPEAKKEALEKLYGCKLELMERRMDYIADFCYVTRDGQKIVEDVKGYRDPSSAPYRVFVIKRKAMLHIFGIEVKEV